MADRQHAALLLLLLAACAAQESGPRYTSVEPERWPVRVGVPSFDSHPFWYNGTGGWPGPGVTASNDSRWTAQWSAMPNGGNWTGFMLPMLEWVCEHAYLDCELVFQDTIPGMLQALVDGETDICGATLSVDPEWMDRVEFIQPYFYSAGIALYMDQMAGQMLSEAGGWDAMSGQKVCAKPGLAQMPALEHQYGIETVEVEMHDEGCAAAANGTRCTAYAFDAGRPKLCQEEGLVQAAGIPPLMTAPFAFSVNKNSTALARRISAALLETMRDGDRSVILEWEKRYVTDQGALPNLELSQVVQAVSQFQVACPACAS